MKVVRKKEIDKIKISHNRGLFWLIIILLIFFVGFLIYANQKFSSESKIDSDERKGIGGEVNIGNECVSDLDCVPEICCHAATCVAVENAPNCGDVFCTMECTPGTMDCGEGKCSCVNGKCEAIFG